MRSVSFLTPSGITKRATPSGITKRANAFVGVCGLFALGAVGCGERPDTYGNAVKEPIKTFALESQVAIVDESANRAVILTPRFDQELDRLSLPVGKGVLKAEVSTDKKRLFVLSSGDVPRRRESDEGARLTVIENDAERRFALESPHSGFAIDPSGRYVALFAAPDGGRQTAFVENPNEIVVVDLQAPAENAVTPRTIRSFGGRPQRVSFTQPLLVRDGSRRLLVIETDKDVQLLDLDHIRDNPRRPEITVRLTTGTNSLALKPAAVVVDDGESGKSDDARIGVRIEGNPNVFTLTLVAAATDARAEEPGTVPNDFRPEVNLTDVGGIPGDITFVRTPAGVRLAAIVPTNKTAVLVDPTTSITTKVEIPEPYSRMSLITNVVGAAGGADTALLYGSGGSRGVAFWSLGKVQEGRGYSSVEVVSLSSAIQNVMDVPPPRSELKVLQGGGANSFFVLNLASRTAAPLTTLAVPSLHISADGQRLWAFQAGSSQLSQVTLDNLHPRPLPLDRTISAVYDVHRIDGARALVAIDPRGGVGATVLDALSPDTAKSKSYYGLLLEDL